MCDLNAIATAADNETSQRAAKIGRREWTSQIRKVFGNGRIIFALPFYLEAFRTVLLSTK